MVGTWRRLRGWRRLRFTSGGIAFTGGTTAVGFAALNTGNNLLYLLLGAMLGFIVVSGWLSEQAIRGVSVERRAPRPVTVGSEVELIYHFRNTKRRLPSVGVEIYEEGLPNPAFVAHVGPGKTSTTRSTNGFVRRGVYPLDTVTLSTSFPFGLFRKERDLHIPGEIVVWPRHDLPVRAGPAVGDRPAAARTSARMASAHRGEYRSLREYRSGDDPRDIHWKSAARLRRPVVREFERGRSDTRWICLDTRGPDGAAAERAVSMAASLAARAAAERRPFALAVPGTSLPPGEGTAALERALDLLARVDFEPEGPPPDPPAGPAASVLVTLHRDGSRAWADTLLAVADGAGEEPNGDRPGGRAA